MDSINIELSGVTNMIRRTLEENNNFRMREYVAAMREKDAMKCYPFPEKIQFALSVDQSIGNENESPPVTARLALVSSSAADSSDHQVSQIGASHLEINELEGTNVSADEPNNILSNSTDHHAILDGQRENNSEAANEAIIGHQMSLDANGSDLIPQCTSACASPAVTTGVIQENPETDCVPVQDEPASRNLRRRVKHNESSESGGSAAVDNQRNTVQLTKKTSESAVRSLTEVADKDRKGQHTTEIDLAASENSNTSSSSSSFRRRKLKKMRPMLDILADVRSIPRPDQLNRNLVTPHDTTSHNASAETVVPGPRAEVGNQTNEERLMPAEEVDISPQKASGKETENKAKTSSKMPIEKDSSFTGRLSKNVLMNNTWSCSRPRMPRRRRRTKGVIRSSLEPIQVDDKENEDFSGDATRVSLPDHLTVKPAPTTFKTKEYHHLPLGDTSGESKKPKKVGEPSRQMSKFEMPWMDDKHGYISQVDDDGINICKQQKDQVTHKRSNQHLEDPVNVADTGILRLFGQQVSCKEKPKEIRNEVADKAKSADCLSSLGANHLHLNSDGQSHIPFGMAEVSVSKGKAPMNISSLRRSSSGLHEGINLELGSSHTRVQVSEGCDIQNSEASLIWTSPTPMELSNYLIVKKVHEAYQPIINVRGKNIIGDEHLPDLNVPCLEAMALDCIMEELSFPWKKLEGSVNTYSKCSIPDLDLLRFMDASKLSSAMTPVGASYPLGTKLCHNGADKNDLSNINTLLNSSIWEKMKRWIGSAIEMATKSKESQSKVGDELPQDSSIIPFQSSSQRNFETLPDHNNTGWPSIEENETPKRQKLQSAYDSGTSFALADIPDPKPINCVLNRNPADFSAPDPKNPHMTKRKYLRIGRSRDNQRESGNKSNPKAA